MTYHSTQNATSDTAETDLVTASCEAFEALSKEERQALRAEIAAEILPLAGGQNR